MQQSKLLFSVFLLIHKMLSQKYIKLDSLIHKKEIYSGWMSPKCLFWFLWTTLWSRINVSPADIYLWNYTRNVLMGVMGGWVVSPHLYLKNVIFKSIRYVFVPANEICFWGFLLLLLLQASAEKQSAVLAAPSSLPGKFRSRLEIQHNLTRCYLLEWVYDSR